jgi:hypothetical protein
MTNLVAIQGDEQLETAGAISYWSLEGEVDLDGLRQSLTIEGLEARLLPTGPTLQEALVRGARASCIDSRQLVRPLGKRGAWAFVQERAVRTDGPDVELEYQQILTGQVVLVQQADGSKREEPEVKIARGVERTEAVDQLVDQILAECDRQRGILAANDVSWWLVYVAKQLHAVSLRERGGVYFVPRDVLPTWRKIARILADETQHKVFEIPAVKTEEAVDAILTAVRAHVRAKFTEAEEYLSGKTSTRGLNALERELEGMKGYVAHYVNLLGVALPELTDKLENIRGAMVAARVLNDAGEDA